MLGVALGVVLGLVLRRPLERRVLGVAFFFGEKERYVKMMKKNDEKMMMKRTKLCEDQKKPYTPREMSLFVVYSYRVSFGNDHQ